MYETRIQISIPIRYLSDRCTLKMVIPLKKININPKVKQSNIKISDGSALKVFG